MAQQPNALARESYVCSALTVDYVAAKVYKNGENVRSTPMEYQIAALISQDYGQVLTYEKIISSIWGPYADADNNRTLRVSMANIRRKIKENSAKPQFIFTEVGVGTVWPKRKRTT